MRLFPIASLAGAAAFVLAFGLAAPPAAAVPLGQATATIDGVFTFRHAPGGPGFTALVPVASGDPNPFAGIAYPYVAEAAGVFTASADLPPETVARWRIDGALSIAGAPAMPLGPARLGDFALSGPDADPDAADLLAAVSALSPAQLVAWSDPFGAFDVFLSWNAAVAEGEATGVFSAFLGFGDPIGFIFGVSDRLAGFDPELGALATEVLSGTLIDLLSGPSQAEIPFSLTVTASATVVPAPVAAPMLIAAVAAAAAASRRRRRASAA